jgi:hypothetical protein
MRAMLRTVQLNIELPAMVTVTEFELKTLLASKLYEKEELSLERGVWHSRTALELIVWRR